MGKTISFRFDDTPKDQAFANSLIGGLRGNYASKKTAVIKQIIEKQAITAEDFAQAVEFPEVQKAIAKSFDLSIKELRGRLEKAPMAFNLRTLGELSEC